MIHPIRRLLIVSAHAAPKQGAKNRVVGDKQREEPEHSGHYWPLVPNTTQNYPANYLAAAVDSTTVRPI